METHELISHLGYADSPHFMEAARFDEVPTHAHILRQAARRCSVQGVYLLRDESMDSSATVPIVYVAEADDQLAADAIHLQVWNQSAVPFLIVRMPQGVRLYSGFVYRKNLDPDRPQEGVLESLVGFHEVSLRLAAFHADQINSGALWRSWGNKVQPEKRVDHRLLGNLEAIGQNLHADGVQRETAHALIGKLVYLRYLRDRDILSDRRLRAWNIDAKSVFGRATDAQALHDLVSHLEAWLNGEIFPLSLVGNAALSSDQIAKTAAVFLGDDPSTGQLHLDFEAYDFSHIPIETLSTIYEQFLAIEGTHRESGAFYTPLPLVNFMVMEMEDHKPLTSGMQVLDPACGSGAFLVQCYRHLIEKRMLELRRELRPTELRDILEQQIFGVDRDGDACRVAQMSLVLTLLDYIDPPDLQSTPTFKLPKLHNKNIYQSDFFDQDSAWATGADKKRFDWIIGNPPWVQQSPTGSETPIQAWLATNSLVRPVNRGQAAEAFAWKAVDFSAKDGAIGLLLPAMTLFKQEPTSRKGFRQVFFNSVTTLAVANFTNLREVLFAGRARLPSAAVFYRPPEPPPIGPPVLVYSPLVINQEANRPTGRSRRMTVWGLVPNSSEITFIERKDLRTGSSLPWKIAMWGTDRDRRLLEKTRRKFDSMETWSDSIGFLIHPGPELRPQETPESVEPVPEVVGQKILRVPRNTGRLYTFGVEHVELIPPELGFLRVRGGRAALGVCKPPHVIVSATRTFAVFTDEYLVVPPRQIAIAGAPGQAPMLKALALYLSSDFASYFELFHAPQKGISRGGLSTLGTLKALPTPLGVLSEQEIAEWCELHRGLVAASREHLEKPLWNEREKNKDLHALEIELNQRVEAALGLNTRERWLVHDLVHVKATLVDGKLGEPAIRRPSLEDQMGYGEMLRDELDSFLDPDEGKMHHVSIHGGKDQGWVAVELVARNGEPPRAVDISEERDPVTLEMVRLQKKHRDLTQQWIYFDRNLFVYDGPRTLIFKPQQRLWWTRSQAMADADEIIAAALAPDRPDG